MSRLKSVAAGEPSGITMLSPEAVARSLGIAKRTLFRMLAEGKFPGPDLRMGCKLPRWKAETLAEWVEQNAAK